MRRRRLGKVIRIALVVAAGVTLFGFIVMGLWNWLAPAVFGWHSITFAQALGLLLLSRILFGSFHGRGGRSGWHWRRRMAERYDQMTPGERERFRQGMYRGCRSEGEVTT